MEGEDIPSVMGNRTVNKYLDVDRRTLLAWQENCREYPVSFRVVSVMELLHYAATNLLLAAPVTF